MAKIAFLGLGNMGRGMAQRLLASGHTVHVYNRTASRAAALVARGARVFWTPRHACNDADGIISMVTDDAASRAMWCGRDGVLAGTPQPGAFAIECSTLSHAWVQELSGQVTSAGLRYIDAPVTGLPDAAATGALTLLVGADPGDLTAVSELLADLADRIIHFGGVGTGTAYKLIVNLLGAVQIASVAESLAIAERAGLDLHTVTEAIAAGQAASPQVVRNSRRMVAGDHDRNILFTPQLRLKDVRYALELARHVRIGSPFGALAEASFQRLCELGLASANESAVIDVARQIIPDRIV